jgi:hypothetical protein
MDAGKACEIQPIRRLFSERIGERGADLVLELGCRRARNHDRGALTNVSEPGRRRCFASYGAAPAFLIRSQAASLNTERSVAPEAASQKEA